MREFGLIISERTLKNFKKDMGLTRKYSMIRKSGCTEDAGNDVKF